MQGMVVLVLIGGILFSLAVAAVVLRAAVSLFNRFAGGAKSERGVPEPSFGAAMGIVFVTSIVNALVGFGIGMAVGALGMNSSMTEQQAQILSQVLALPIGFLVMSGMFAAMLPTTFVRGLLVALCYYLVFLFLAVIVAGMAYLVLTYLQPSYY